MEQKKNEMIVEMVKKLRQMDNSSLVIMKASVDILAAKERLDNGCMNSLIHIRL